MVKQYTENQYDDDLTVGTDDYDDSYYTGSVDLFEFSNDEESPISRLKSLILSIDWAYSFNSSSTYGNRFRSFVSYANF